MGNPGNLQNILRDLSQINFIQIGFIIAGAWVLTLIIRRGLAWLAQRYTGRLRLFFLGAIPAIRLIIIGTAIILTVPRIIQPTFENLVALLGAAGLALGFAFKDYISSLIAGVVAVYELPYRPGDWIEVDGTYGEVREIHMRAVEIITPDDTVVVVPHLKIWDRLIHNGNYGSKKLMCVADFYLHPQHNAVEVKKILYDVALTSPMTKIDEPITVIIMEKPWGTHYRLKAYPIDPREQFHFTTDLTVRAKEALIKMGVEFATLPALDAASSSAGGR